MFDWLARILNSQRSWLGDHPNARQVRKVKRPSGCFEVEYRDDASGERATYYTDDLGNVQLLDITVPQ